MEEKPEKSRWEHFRELFRGNFWSKARKGGEKFEEATRKYCSSEKVKAAGDKIAKESRECVHACKRTLSKFRRKE